MEQILKALTKCRQQIEAGIEHKSPNPNTSMSLVKQGAFGLQIMEIMLSDPVSELQGTEVHVIRIDGIEMPDPFNSIMKKPETKRTPCPCCDNEEIAPDAKYCKICGFKLLEKTQVQPEKFETGCDFPLADCDYMKHGEVINSVRCGSYADCKAAWDRGCR